MATIDTLSIDVKASVDKAVSSLKRFSGAMGEVKSANDGAAQATKNTTFAFEASASGLLKAANMLKGAGLKNLAKEYSKMAELVNFRSLEDATKAFFDAADQFAQHGDESTAKFIRDRADLVAKERELIEATNQLKQAEEQIAAAQARAQEIQETAAKSELAYVELTKKAQLEKADAILKAYTDMAAKIAKENEASDKAYAELTKADKNKKADARIKEILDAEKERQAKMAEYVRIARESEAAYDKMMREERNRQADAQIKRIIDTAAQRQAALQKAKADKEAERAAQKRSEEEARLSRELKRRERAERRAQRRAARDEKSQKALKNAFKGLGEIMPKLESKFFGFFRMFGRIAMYRAVRAAIKAITAALKEGLTNLKAYSKEVGTAFAPAVDNLRSHVLWLKNAIATALRPVIEALIPVIQRLVDWLVKASDFLAQVFSIMTGKVDENGRYTKAVLTDLQDSNEEAKKLQRTLLGFDEINRLDGDNGSGSQQNAGLMFTQADVSDKAIEWAAKLTEWLNKAKEIIGNIDWGAVIAVLGALKGVQIISKVVKWVKTIATILGGSGGLVALVAAVVLAFSLWGDKIGEWIDGITETVDGFFETLEGNISGGVLHAIVQFVGDAVTLVMGLISSIAKMLYKFTHGDFEGALDELWNIVKIVLKGIVGVVLGALNLVLGFIQDALNLILLGVRWIYNNAIVPFVNTIATIAMKIYTWVHNAFLDVRIAVLTVIKFILDKVNAALQEIIGWVNDVIASFNEMFGTDLEPIEFKIDTEALDDKINELENKKLPPITEKVELFSEWKEPKTLNLQINTKDAYAAIDRLGQQVNRIGTALGSALRAADGNNSPRATMIQLYASGGFPQIGSLFIAGEAGQEWVGDINGRTGVMNTDQMAAAIYSAMSAALANNPQGGDIYLDGEVIYRNTVRRNNNQVRATGRTALLT